MPVDGLTTRPLPVIVGDPIHPTEGAQMDLRLDQPTWVLPGAAYHLAPGVRIVPGGLADEAGHVYPLNEVGRLLCRIGREPTDIDTLVDGLAERSQRPVPDVRTELVGFLSALGSRGLLSIHQSFARETWLVARQLPMLLLASRIDRSLLRGTRFPLRRYAATPRALVRGCLEAHQSVLWIGVLVCLALALTRSRIETLNRVTADTGPALLLVVLGFFLLVPVTAMAHEFGHVYAAARLGVACSGCYVRRGVAGVTYPTARRGAAVLITLAGPLSGIASVVLVGCVWMLAKPFWILAGIDQLGLSVLVALAALALMQALALTPITRDGRTILVHVGAWFMEGRSRC